jgi:hypothetical protein
MKQSDWADRSWLLKQPQLAADYHVKTLTTGIIVISAIILWVI